MEISVASGTLGPLDTQRQSPLAIRPSSHVLARSLGAATAESITVPANARWVQMQSGSERLYYNLTATATVPGDVTDGTASDTNTGGLLFINGVTTISVIAVNACVVTASFWTD